MSVLAVGDSITRGLNTVVGDLPSQSYARWVAAALGVKAVVLADAGVTSWQALDRFGDQIAGRHDLGVVFVGANDALAKRWEPARFADAHAELLRRVADCSAVVATMTIPTRTGRMLVARRRLVEANDIIRKNAAECGAVVVDLGDLAGTRLVWSDLIHPTSWGQIEIADRLALAAGLNVRPSALAAGQMGDPGWRYSAKYVRFGVRYAVRQSAHRVARLVT